MPYKKYSEDELCVSLKGLTEEQLMILVQNYMLKHKSFEGIRTLLKLNDKELIDLVDKINCTNNQKTSIEYIRNKAELLYDKQSFTVHKLGFPKKKLKLAFVSDKHLDHTDDRIGYINDVYEEAIRRGTDYVFDLGDILNGPKERVHRPEKVRTGTLDGCMTQLIKHHPKEIPTYFITGNHDLKFMDTNQVDIGRLMQKECPNMVFLNNLFTCIDIGGLHLNISHGAIEGQYLSDMNLLKTHEFLKFNDPHIICQGHFHIGRANETGSPLLYQIPSLKSDCGPTRAIKLNTRGYDIGAVFLTIREVNGGFEVEHEQLEFIESRKYVKTKVDIKTCVHIEY